MTLRRGGSTGVGTGCLQVVEQLYSSNGAHEKAKVKWFASPQETGNRWTQIEV